MPFFFLSFLEQGGVGEDATLGSVIECAGGVAERGWAGFLLVEVHELRRWL